MESGSRTESERVDREREKEKKAKYNTKDEGENLITPREGF
jgi:hypothetical protein